MDISGDYTDDLNDSSGRNFYERPLFIRNRDGNELKSKNKSKRIRKPNKKPKSSISNNENTYAPLIFFIEDDDEESGGRDTLNATHQQGGQERKGNGERYYEYGDPISGYKFITTQEKYEQLKESVEQNESTEDSIDEFEFDRYPKKRHDENLNTRSFISKYWKRASNEPLIFPVLPSYESSEVSIDDITESSVKDFYLRSCDIMNMELSSVLKRERVLWHPDRLIGKISNYDDFTIKKVTKIFQIVNDLWESL